MGEPVQAPKGSCIQRAGTKVSEGLERLFFALGYHTAKRPRTVIMCCILGSGLCGLGLLRFDMKDMSEAIWVPPSSKVLSRQRWAEEHFPLKYRFNDIILVASNVLSPGAFAAMMKIDKLVKKIEEANSTKNSLNFNWTTLCMRLGPECWSSSLLTLWQNDEDRISKLTTQEILARINGVLADKASDNATMIKQLLGDVSYDAHGKVVGAKAAKMLWAITSSISDELNTRAKVPELDWERQFIKVTASSAKELSPSYQVYIRAVRSFRDESDSSFDADVTLLVIGVAIIIIYVAVVLGKFNEVEHKVYLALVGVFGIGLASLVAYGIASGIGMFYGPIHPILPFLLLGVGVDDMFVIVEAWNNLSAEQKNAALVDRIALTMKHAGVSVTVTSVTDCVAFAIGATTELPALRSFCVYACLGIFALYVMQATFFVAWLTIDARRQEAFGDACCMFVKHTHFRPTKCSRKEFLPWFLRKFYARALTTMPAKVTVTVTALAIFGVTVFGSYKLRTDSDLAWFLPTDSYLSSYLKAINKHYPDDGLMANLYIGNINYHAERTKLLQMHTALKGKDYVVGGSLRSWYLDYISWLRSNAPPDISTTLNKDKYPQTENAFYDYLLRYISTAGMRHFPSIKWNTTDLSQPRKLNATKIEFTMKNLPSSTKEVLAMASMDQLTDEFFGTDAFVWNSAFRNWETNRIIQSELYTNLCLAFVAVLLVTLTLVANIWMCILVCLCVIVNVVNVCGFMHFWGLTIDTLTSILLILSIGLAVDYSVHIGHMFMMVEGSKDERTRRTVSLIGPAVIHGGFSTFLAFVLLCNSNSYVFITFFKVFFLVVIFGLFNGVTLLPVVLSWVGPAPHLNAWTPQLSSLASTPPTAQDEGRNNLDASGHPLTQIAVADKGSATATLQLPSSNDEQVDSSKSKQVPCVSAELTTVQDRKNEANSSQSHSAISNAPEEKVCQVNGTIPKVEPAELLDDEKCSQDDNDDTADTDDDNDVTTTTNVLESPRHPVRNSINGSTSHEEEPSLSATMDATADRILQRLTTLPAVEVGSTHS